MFQQLAVGGSIPPDTPHAVSVSLPTWKAVVGYEEGQEWVFKSMKTGYPRFFVHHSIQALAGEIVRRFGSDKESATLFPSPKTANCCYDFMISRILPANTRDVKIVNLRMAAVPSNEGSSEKMISSGLSCVIYPKEYSSVAKQVWQHTGDGISSRRGEFCLRALENGYLVENSRKPEQSSIRWSHKGPKRYQVITSTAERLATQESKDHTDAEASDKTEIDHIIEERFGRNLDATLADQAKLAVRRRIAGSLIANIDLHEALDSEPSDARVAGLTEDHVYLFPTGMSSIFNMHQALLGCRRAMKSICFGFPYTDTLKVLQKWGPGVLFYPNASSEELDDLQTRLESGERFLSLFTEFPGNPLLKSPDLERIRSLADKYDFAIVIDESVGNFINVNVLPYADVVVSSLTKIFSGDSNVMGGSAVLNPHRKGYWNLRNALDSEYEDNYWAEDAVFLERNSRDFVSRIVRINAATESITSQLRSSPLVKHLCYPLYDSTRPLYDKCKTPEGRYGGLFSVIFHRNQQAISFFDSFNVMKGPSLGTNFTLSCPYTILAHYSELEWAESVGVPSHLVRVSIGLEDIADLRARIQSALDAAARATTYDGSDGSITSSTMLY